ncbi:MAG: histidine kinase N-terminal 7TM domain-containing protein, partial [Ferruginibacter sp.]
MSPSPLSLIVLLAAGVSFGAAGLASRRPAVAGRQAFVWLMLALGTWSLLSDLHTLVPAPALKVAVAKLQYLSIASVSLLWLLVVHRAVGLPQLRHRHVGVLAVIPLLTVAAAWTNDWHGWLWAQITPVCSTLVYHHGPWFWVAVAYNYGLLVAALVLLVRALRHTPPPFHPQLRVMIAAAALPWVGNALYLTHAIPIPGLDPTPLAFTLSGLLFFWALTTYQFLDLVPIARSVLFDHLEDGVLLVDRSRRVVDVNLAARRLADLDAAVIGQPLDSALPALSGAITVSRDRTAAVLVEPFGLAAASIEVRATPLLGTRGQEVGWLVVLRDMTTQQSLLRQLRAEHEFALQVMQMMGEGLTVTDAAGQFTFVNDAYARLFGYKPADLIGRRPQELTVEMDHAALQAAWEQRAAGQPSTYLSRLRCADGRMTTVQITGTPRIVNGTLAGSIAVITDLSERLAQEEALRTAEQTLRSFFDSAGVMMGIVELGDDDILHVVDNIVTATFFGTSVEAMRGQWA